MSALRAPPERAVRETSAIVAWYFRVAYGRWEGPGRVPYYCDPARVGAFAVAPDALARGDDEALFRLFVATAMYQVRRDVDVMAIQRAMPARAARDLLSPRRLRVLVEGSRCEHVAYADAFDAACSVGRDLERARGVCDYRPRTPCHVKTASQAMRRMGDMGKIPTSAWLHLYGAGEPRAGAQRAGVAARRSGGGAEAGAAAATPRSLGALVERVVREEPDARARADRLVESLARVYRVGRKLATMYVSALSVPPLAPGLTPWYPAIDGTHLVVVDTNVARAVDALRGRARPASYDARARWVQRVAAAIDLRGFHPDVPAYAPRMVQQALYLFRSAANRGDRGDACAASKCGECVARVCPFTERSG